MLSMRSRTCGLVLTLSSLMLPGLALAAEPLSSARSEAVSGVVPVLTSAVDSPLADAVKAAGSAAGSGEVGAAVAQDGSAPPPRVFEYSDAYRMRAKIHRISSFATLPLFAAEAFVGESLYNEPTSAKKDAHLAVAGGIGALFGINTVTGIWNLIEGRKDPNHRGRRLAHGLMMLGADAGFLATAALAPENEHGLVEGSKATHRAVAFTSVGLAGASYLIMLLGGH